MEIRRMEESGQSEYSLEWWNSMAKLEHEMNKDWERRVDVKREREKKKKKNKHGNLFLATKTDISRFNSRSKIKHTHSLTRQTNEWLQ